MTTTPFSRPRRNRSASAPEAFIAGATADALTPNDAGSVLIAVAPAPTSEPLVRPVKEREVASQTVRFTEREKQALVRLSNATRRSEHFIIKEILGPALLARAAALDEKTAAE